MKKMIIFSILIFVSGCSSAQTITTFRGKTIFAGQSNDSVEKALGQPDWALNAQIRKYDFKANKIDFGIYPGSITIEWGYWDQPKTLIIWLEGNSVRAIWLADTSKFPEAQPKSQNPGQGYQATTDLKTGKIVTWPVYEP
jgi:hypothetical protein